MAVLLTLIFSSIAQVPRLNFVPTTEFPALQYFGELEKGGQADVQGVKTGDFILEVSKRLSLHATCKLAKNLTLTMNCFFLW